MSSSDAMTKGSRKEDSMLGSSSRRGRKVVGLAVAMLAVGALVVTPVTAATFLTKKKADKRYLQNTSEAIATAVVNPGEGTAITVPCPAGLQGVGGGADSPADASVPMPSELMLLLESKPLLSGGRSVGWYVEVAVIGSPLTITAHAVCSK